jgi:ankyrin repeat protein
MSVRFNTASNNSSKETDETLASLFRAIKDMHREKVVRLLQDQRRDLNSLNDSKGCTPLSVAALIKNKQIAFQICKILIDSGASPRTPTGIAGRTALIIMVWHRNFDANVAELLRESIDDQDDNGRTALMFAAEGAGLFGSKRGNLSIAKDLLQLGAHLSIQDCQGLTALGHAMKSNSTDKNDDMVRLLKDKMEKQAAVQELRNRYHIGFDDKGIMNMKLKC